MLGASAGTAVLGRLLELVELLMIAVGAFALVALALAYVRLFTLRLDAWRQIRPPRLHTGEFGRVELVVRNTATRQSPLLVVIDPFDGGRRLARFALAPLAPGETATAAYRAPTERRGVYSLGPLELQILDPFGLAAHCVPGCQETKLTVYPKIELIDPPPAGHGDLSLSASGRRSSLAVTGEDFYALREYELGDDLRRVNWKSTAKFDTLMIRQEEAARQGRCTVVLDLRQEIHSPATVESAVSAAASVVHACIQIQTLVRLVCNDGTDSGFGPTTAHLHAILDHLAEAQAGAASTLDSVLSALAREGDAGTLTIVTTDAVPRRELRSPTPAGSFTTTTVVLLGASPRSASLPVPGARVVAVGEGQPLAPAWSGIPGEDRR